jgi:hypothetical protein
MPWEIKKRGAGYCVVKKDSGAVVKCHALRANAVSHLKALYANTKEERGES